LVVFAKEGRWERKLPHKGNAFEKVVSHLTKERVVEEGEEYNELANQLIYYIKNSKSSAA
jgi:hypothetical protein